MSRENSRQSRVQIDATPRFTVRSVLGRNAKRLSNEEVATLNALDAGMSAPERLALAKAVLENARNKTGHRESECAATLNALIRNLAFKYAPTWAFVEAFRQDLAAVGGFEVKSGFLALESELFEDDNRGRGRVSATISYEDRGSGIRALFIARPEAVECLSISRVDPAGAEKTEQRPSLHFGA